MSRTTDAFGPIVHMGRVTVSDGSFDNWFVITDENGGRINGADIEGDRDEMLMLALAIEEGRPESFKRCAVWPDGDGFCLQNPRNSMRATRISKEQAKALARDIRLHFAPPATDATTLALEAQTAELAKLREENATMRTLCDVAAAMGVFEGHRCGSSDTWGNPIPCTACDFRTAVDAYRALTGKKDPDAG